MRLYTVEFTNVAVSAAQDLFGILATANMAIKLHRVEIGQKTLTSWEAKEIQIIRNPATVTVGSGGTSYTPQPLNPDDVASTFTARVNDTGLQATSGTAQVMAARTWEFLNGFIWEPLSRDHPWIIKPSQGLAIRLGTAPSAPMTASGYCEIEEIF